MKKRIGFRALIALALIFITFCVGLLGCASIDEIKNLINGGQSDGGKSSERENAGIVKIVTSREQKNSETNKLVAAGSSSSTGADDVLLDSWYDDDNYCYIVYLGRINNFILHDVHTFYYTKEYRVYGKTNVVLKEATEETVQTSYRRTVQRSTTRTVEDTIKSSVGAKVSAKFGAFTDEVSANVEAEMKQTLSGTVAVADEEFYNRVVTRSKELVHDLTLDYDACEENVWYNYAICTDVDVYAAICYNPQEENVTYNYYTDIVGKIRERVFSSKNEDFGTMNENFQLDLSSFIFKKPKKYVTNHPPIEHVIVGPEKIDVKRGTTIYPKITFDEIHKKDGTTVPALKYYLDNGYNHIDVKVEFSFDSAVSQMRFYLCPIRDTDSSVFYLKELKNGDKTIEIKGHDLSEFTDYGVMYLVFRNANVLEDFKITAFKATVKIYR